MSGDTFIVTSGDGAPGISEVEATDAAKESVMPMAVLSPSPSTQLGGLHVNSA